MIRSTIIALAFAFSFQQQAAAQSLNLNKALLDCIMSGGACLDHTGIPIVDTFLGNGVNAPIYTQHHECDDLQKSWCSGNGGYPGSGFVACREVKKAYYKQKSQQNGQWAPPTGQKPNNYNMWTEDDYFKELEKRLSKHNEPAYFTCNAKQRELYMKARCGVHFMDWRYLPTITIDCDNDE